VARVERRDAATGRWVPYADQSGEVVTALDMPEGVQGVADSWTGRQEWRWTASFEVFDGRPETLGQVPDGEYRFVVAGHHREGGETSEYQLESDPFRVTPWEGIDVRDLRIEPDGSASFAVAPIDYPDTYKSPVAFIQMDEDWVKGDHLVCHTCSFRPWDDRGDVARAVVTVHRHGGRTVQVPAALRGDRWVTPPLRLRPHDRVAVERGGVVDTWGEINGASETGPAGMIRG
jgi:hypothetical protein